MCRRPAQTLLLTFLATLATLNVRVAVTDTTMQKTQVHTYRRRVR